MFPDDDWSSNDGFTSDSLESGFYAWSYVNDEEKIVENARAIWNWDATESHQSLNETTRTFECAVYRDFANENSEVQWAVDMDVVLKVAFKIWPSTSSGTMSAKGIASYTKF